MNCAYQGLTRERTQNANSVRIIYQGTQEEINNLFSSLEIGVTEDENGYTLRSMVMQQKDGPIWNLEVTYSDSSDNAGRGPSTGYNERAATLECSCVTVPIETLPAYRKHWDHYLLIGELADSSGTLYTEHSTEVLPPFWETADASFLMPTEFIQQFKWAKSPSELPQYVGNDRRKWRVFANPTKPGLAYVDKATYRIRETVRCRSASDAGLFAGNIINKIVTPAQRFGIKASQGSWKCDSASISWNGKDWIATMLYTMSADKNGWDTDLYGESDEKIRD